LVPRIDLSDPDMSDIKADGAAGARRAAALLGIAACAETVHTTLSEEAAKIDMKLSFRHAFNSTAVTVHAQVKSGRSFRAKASSKTQLTLNIDLETLTALRESTAPGLLVWVPPVPLSRLYWYASDPRRPFKSPAKIQREQYVRPSIRYDLTRVCTYAGWQGAAPQQTAANIDEASVLNAAKQAYADLKANMENHPLVGNLRFTRMAWRHVTRRSKSRARRNLRLRATPYLKAFLSRLPDRFVCNQGPITPCGRKMVDERYILCWYRKALSIRGENYTLLVRIKEVITFPTNWENQPIGTRDVNQVATLASWWCKREK
jgi:hypothetical protein